MVEQVKNGKKMKKKLLTVFFPQRLEPVLMKELVVEVVEQLMLMEGAQY